MTLLLSKIPSTLLCILSVAVCASQTLKTVQPEDIADIRKVSDPQISPDGKLVAYVVEIPAKSGAQKNAHIWLAYTDKSRPPTPFVSSERTDTSPRWSPGGQTLAFISDRANPMSGPGNGGFSFQIGVGGNQPDLLNKAASEEEQHKHERQVWAISVHGGEAYPLTDIAGGVKAFKWSRDGKFIAFVRSDTDTKAESDRKKRKADQILVDRDYHFDRLWTYDLATHTARLVTSSNVNVDDFDLSPDGTSALARISPTPRLNDYWYVSKIVILNLTTGEIFKTLSERASPEAVHWFRGGGKVLYGEKTIHEIAGLTIAEDLNTGKKTTLGGELKLTLRLADWTPDGSAVTVQGVEGTRTFFGRLNIESGVMQKLSEVTSDGYTFTQSDDGKTIAYLGQASNRPDGIWAYTQEGGPQSLANHNPQVANLNLGAVREVEWTSSKDGRKIYGVLVLPPGYQPGTSHQTIVHAHGGPFEAWQSGWLGTWYEWAQLLASHGYVVLAPNPRGSQGQGSSFQEANFQDWGGGDFQDIMDGVDVLISQKIADPARLGIGGWSYGGFMTSWAITHTNRFKAAVVGAAVTDLYGMSTTTDIAPNFLNEFFGSFTANRELYDRHSPMRFIENCHTPALVLHGDVDDRVPAFQGAEFYKGLQLLGRESQMVRYPREPHIFTEREHQIDSLQRIVDWFDSHLR